MRRISIVANIGVGRSRLRQSTRQALDSTTQAENETDASYNSQVVVDEDTGCHLGWLISSIHTKLVYLVSGATPATTGDGSTRRASRARRARIVAWRGWANGTHTIAAGVRSVPSHG